MDGTLKLPLSLWGGLKTPHIFKNKNKYNHANLYENNFQRKLKVMAWSNLIFEICGSISSISKEVLGLAHAVCELAWVNLIK